MKDGSLFTGKLVTRGRSTGQPRTVELRLVYLGGRFYASTASLDRKHWCKNMLEEPRVQILCGHDAVSCHSRILEDNALRAEVLRIRGAASGDDRTVFEMIPDSDAALPGR